MAEISLNIGQSECLEKLIRWWKHGRRTKQTFGISGLAGCGKTFVIKYLIETLSDLSMDDVLFVAYVGKAAMQMTKSGVNASTIHSAIYHPIEVNKKDEDGKPIIREGRPVTELKFVKKSSLAPYKLIVVDEAPMVDKKVAKDLLSFGLPIITLGDLNQLPPVIGDSFFLKEPDHTLTEIMRQKQGNPILTLAENIIYNRFDTILPGVYGNNLLIMKKKDFMSERAECLLKSDIVICGKNATREDLNYTIRKLYFEEKGIYGNLPEMIIGDKIICRKNNWNVAVDNYNLINGLVGTIKNIYYEDKTYDTIPIDFQPDFLPESQYFEYLKLNTKFFNGTKVFKDKMKLSPHNGELFEFGYAITCHLSQGSQYDRVIVFSERMGDQAFYKRWLYTAVTRASQKLVLLI